MSTPLGSNAASSPQPFQIILESFTRCFSPISEPCTKSCIAPNTTVGTGGRAAPFRRDGWRDGSASSFSQLFGLNIRSAEKLSRAVSRSDSSSESWRRKKQALSIHDEDVDYDADGVARAKRTHGRVKRVLSAEELAERSMKRKLEIFRGIPHPLSGMATGDCASQQRGQLSRQQAQEQPQQKRPASPRLLLSDDEDELTRLMRGKRLACGVNLDQMGRSSPISSVAKLFNLGVKEGQEAKLFNFGIKEARKSSGLCFANPVRTASCEDVANMSDDRLTDEEFLRRHRGAGVGAGSVATPEADSHRSSSSYNEDDTITSTLYFEAKYGHVTQTRPPMPLFQEYAVACGVYAGAEDGQGQMIRWRGPTGDEGVGQPPIREISSYGRGGSDRGSGASGSPEKKRTEIEEGGQPLPVRTGDDSVRARAVSDDFGDSAEGGGRGARR